MQVAALYREIVAYCQANADPALVKKYSRYFTEGYDAYGLGKNVIPNKCNEILARSAVTLDLVLQLGNKLSASHRYEEIYFATRLIQHFYDDFTTDTFTAIERWFELGVVNWAHCDVICRDVTGSLLKRNIVGIDKLASWRTAVNTYQRRAVPVALIEILKDTSDFKPLLDLIDPLMHDPEKKVQQGLGWFLREAWKLQPEPVEAFLLRYKDSAPRQIYQYACEKMTREQKLKFTKSKP